MRHWRTCIYIVFLTYLISGQPLHSQDTEKPIQINGIFPEMTVMAPGTGSTSETGIGALIPWAEKLWAVGYVAHIQGEGIGLYEISEDMTMRKHPASVTGTFANRLVHWPSGQAIIGPHIIDADGKVRTFEALKNVRLTATMHHLTNRDSLVYFLTMEGPFYQANVYTLETTLLFDLVDELDIPGGAQPHFKGGYTGHGRVIVANNTYDEAEFQNRRQAGVLAEWDGEDWSIIDRNPFVEVNGQPNYGHPIFATGWDRSSVILKVFINDEWRTYRLPKASHAFDHTWNTEWYRIRQAQTERLLMDVHGMFYELPPFIYDDHVWGIRPISTHLRVIPDFVSWRGMLVLASDQTDHDVGQPQSGLWFGKIDDLWNFGKPKGWGGPWWDTEIQSDEYSDPFLMTGFDKKVLHLYHDLSSQVDFTIEVDFLGNGTWKEYETIQVSEGEYVHHEFPDGFSAHWIRLKTNSSCTATAYFMYN